MKVLGFGSFTKKGAVHLIVEDGEKSLAVCNQKELLPEDGKTLLHVSCGNCKRAQVYLDSLKDASEEEKSKGNSKVIIDEADCDMIDLESIAIDLKNGNDIPKWRSIFINELYGMKSQFIAKIKENGKGDIIHRLSGIGFFESVEERYIPACLLMLNRIEEHWSGQGSISKQFLAKAKNHMSAGYFYANSLDDKQGKTFRELEELKLVLEEHSTMLDKETQDNKRLAEENDRLKSMMIDFNTKIFTLEEQLATLGEKTDSQEKEIENLNKQIDSIKAKKDDDISPIIKEAECRNAIRRRLEEIEKLNKRLESINAKKDDAKKDDAKNTIKRRLEEVKKLNKKIESIKAEKDDTSKLREEDKSLMSQKPKKKRLIRRIEF